MEFLSRDGACFIMLSLSAIAHAAPARLAPGSILLSDTWNRCIRNINRL